MIFMVDIDLPHLVKIAINTSVQRIDKGTNSCEEGNESKEDERKDQSTVSTAKRLAFDCLDN